MLIINADDFGWNARINKAIIQSFKRGLCSSATLMPNMPGFDEACELIHENKLINHIGLHLTLSENYPLTEGIKRFPRFCNDRGKLCLARNRAIFILGTPEKKVLAEEIKAQIKRCRSRKIPVTHVDSHYLVHTEWGIAAVLITIARQEGIPHMRISRNIGPDIPFYKKAYKYIFNNRIGIAGLRRTRYFGQVEDFIFFKKQMKLADTVKSCEIMIHPKFNDKQVLIDDLSGKALEALIKKVDSYKDAVSFKGIKYL
jgi:predicted glycoside hydrolase/deacetylase ChbG (UPF0249 family)